MMFTPRERKIINKALEVEIEYWKSVLHKDRQDRNAFHNFNAATMARQKVSDEEALDRETERMIHD